MILYKDDRNSVRLARWGLSWTRRTPIPNGNAYWYPVHIRWLPKISLKRYGGHRPPILWPLFRIKRKYVHKRIGPTWPGYCR